VRGVSRPSGAPTRGGVSGLYRGGATARFVRLLRGGCAPAVLYRAPEHGGGQRRQNRERPGQAAQAREASPVAVSDRPVDERKRPAHERRREPGDESQRRANLAKRGRYWARVAIGPVSITTSNTLLHRKSRAATAGEWLRRADRHVRLSSRFSGVAWGAECVPAGVARFLRRCLGGDAERRIPSKGDVRLRRTSPVATVPTWWSRRGRAIRTATMDQRCANVFHVKHVCSKESNLRVQPAQRCFT
jgi:hypothetical protein